MRIVGLLIVAGTAWAAANVVVGTGDPNLDVPAVQAAVDQGGHVVLHGHFSFDRSPSPPTGMGFPHEVLVSKKVVISGTRDGQGEMTTIEGGIDPFGVEAPGTRVTIQRLRFVHPKGNAIEVTAVSGLVIAYCRIEGLEPQPNPAVPGPPIGAGILVATTPHGALPTADQPGRPENVSRTLSIFDNDIAVVGTAGLRSLGIVISSVGKSPDTEVDIYVSGNNIRNATARALEIQQIGGRAYIERNVIMTSANMRPGGGAMTRLVDGIKCAGSGSYLITH